MGYKVKDFIEKTPYTIVRSPDGKGGTARRTFMITSLDGISHEIGEVTRGYIQYTTSSFVDSNNQRLPSILEDPIFELTKNNGLAELVKREGWNKNLRLAKR